MNLYIILLIIGLVILSGIIVFVSKSLKKTVKSSFEIPPKILIADDTAEILKFVEIILSKSGFFVKTCSGGLEAEKIAQEEKFDIIILDIFMPDKDGFSVAKSIRDKGLNSKSHLIALTACENKELAAAHFEAGFDEAIQKPVLPEKLLRKINLAVAKLKQYKSADEGKTIISNFKDDPDYKRTIEQFVKELPEKVKAIEDDFYGGNIEQLKKKIHSLKGLGGFAGFPIFTEKAKEIEQNLTADRIENVRKQVNELILLCKNTRLTEKK